MDGQGWTGNPYMGTFYIDYNEIKASNSDTYFSDNIEIFPNPSAGQFTISFGTNPVRQAIIKIFSLQGNLVYSELIQNRTSVRIDLTIFPKGMYIVKAITNKNNYNGKVCLE